MERQSQGRGLARVSQVKPSHLRASSAADQPATAGRKSCRDTLKALDDEKNTLGPGGAAVGDRFYSWGRKFPVDLALPTK